MWEQCTFWQIWSHTCLCSDSHVYVHLFIMTCNFTSQLIVVHIILNIVPVISENMIVYWKCYPAYKAQNNSTSQRFQYKTGTLIYKNLVPFYSLTCAEFKHLCVTCVFIRIGITNWSLTCFHAALVSPWWYENIWLAKTQHNEIFIIKLTHSTRNFSVLNWLACMSTLCRYQYKKILAVKTLANYK